MDNSIYEFLKTLNGIYNRRATLREVKEKYVSKFGLEKFELVVSELLSKNWIIINEADGGDVISPTGLAEIAYANDGNHNDEAKSVYIITNDTTINIENNFSQSAEKIYNIEKINNSNFS